jgi:ATP-dependent Clp protease protease subunit
VVFVQIDEDTDRDRYMSPLEAKQYGLIDHIIGGDDAGFKVCRRRQLMRA